MNKKIMVMLLIGMSLMGCKDEAQTCGMAFPEGENETVIFDDPDAPIQIQYEVEVDNVYFEGTYEIGPQFIGGTVDLDSSAVVNVLKANFEYDDKVAVITITFDKETAAIEKISFEPNVDEDFEIFSCIGAGCAGAIANESNKKFTLTDVILTKEGGVETETISGVLTYKAIPLGDAVIEYESCE